MSDRCPHHDEATIGHAGECELQKLAEHTITVTEARRPGVRVIVVLMDSLERFPEGHLAMGASGMPPEVVVALLEEEASRVRAAFRLPPR